MTTHAAEETAQVTTTQTQNSMMLANAQSFERHEETGPRMVDYLEEVEQLVRLVGYMYQVLEKATQLVRLARNAYQD